MGWAYVRALWHIAGVNMFGITKIRCEVLVFDFCS